MAIQPGQVVARRYQVIQHLGSGGMASVYKVWDRERAVHLALKILRPDLTESGEWIDLFQQEATHLEKLSHPHIVRFYELAWDGEDVFLLMEFVEGRTLRQELSERSPLSSARIRNILRPVCTALYYAHTQGVIHCDLKPANILIDQAGKTFISDFGIAQAIHTAGSQRQEGNLTGAGSPAYMAPEQGRNETPCPETDLYSLGIVLYEMLTGRRPFSGGSAPVHITRERDRLHWEKTNTSPAPPGHANPRVSAQVDQVVMRCLKPYPGGRYHSALDFFNDLERAFGAGETARSGGAKVAGDRASTGPGPAGDTAGSSTLKQAAKPRLPVNLKVVVVVGIAVTLVIAGLLALAAVGIGPGSRPGVPSPAAVIHDQEAFEFDSACMTFPVPYQPQTKLEECVEKIVVLPDGTIRVYVTWTAYGVSSAYGVTVGADTGNRNMYLTDDQGNRLDHINAGEGANQEVTLASGQSKKGWFLFPAPEAGARYLIFHDDDNGGTTPALKINGR